jgi:small nuclear ribonucleoprotein (snRNP)-like protein
MVIEINVLVEVWLHISIIANPINRNLSINLCLNKENTGKLREVDLLFDHLLLIFYDNSVVCL